MDVKLSCWRQTSSTVGRTGEFALHVTVSAGVCVDGKGQMYFVDEKAKVVAAHCLEELLPILVEDIVATEWFYLPETRRSCSQGTRHTGLAEYKLYRFHHQRWVTPNSPDLSPLDYHVWGTMLKSYHKLQPKPKTIAEFKNALQLIWSALLQKFTDNAVKDSRKQL